jgi:hypothetical protein
MPDIISKGHTPQRKRRDGIHVPGIFEAWHRCRCAGQARWAMVDRDSDPRFTDPDDESPFDTVAYEAKLAEARAVAEATAARVLSRGKPITATLLPPRKRLKVWWEPQGSGLVIPDSFQADAVYTIWPDDTVAMNAVATERHRARNAEDEARRKTAVAQQDRQQRLSQNRTVAEHNGHEVIA